MTTHVQLDIQLDIQLSVVGQVSMGDSGFESRLSETQNCTNGMHSFVYLTMVLGVNGEQ